MTTTEKPALDATLINALVTSTQSILSTMANTSATVKEVKAHREYQPTGDISAVIGLNGNNGEGTLAICFPLTLAKLIVARLLGQTPERISSSDCADGIGELVNMISGNVKTVLSRESGATYTLSLPSIIAGKGHEIVSAPKNSPFLFIQFEVEQETFMLQVTFKFIG